MLEWQGQLSVELEPVLIILALNFVLLLMVEKLGLVVLMVSGLLLGVLMDALWEKLIVIRSAPPTPTNVMVEI